MAPIPPPPLIDRSAPRRWRASTLGLLGVGLVLALLAVVLVQARQYTLLRQAIEADTDFGVLTIFEAETDFLRLRDEWRVAAEHPEALDAARLRQRFRDWKVPFARLRVELETPVRGGANPYRQTLDAADAFIAGTDRVLGETPQAEPDRAFIEAGMTALETLERPLHAIGTDTAKRLTAKLAQRAEAARAQNRLGLGLTVFLSLLTLAFAALSLRQLRRLQERRVVLEDLAHNLHDARQQAERASAAKSDFLANMSHEIRTPFHGLMGMLSLLRESGLSPRQIDHLHTATKSADHLLALLDDILDMSQLESGRVTLAPAAVDLRALLREVEALVRPQASVKFIALHIDADPSVPERVLADATRVKQVVFNLLSNAIKFSDHGAVVLDLRCRPAEPGGPVLHFVVTDTGIGMDEAMLAHLFNRFMKGDSLRSRRHAGSGLGLEISRNLARLMGGDITVRSKPGEGSCFTFVMPAVPAPAAQPVTPSQLDAFQHALQVLVAEDHPINRQYMAALLKSMGHVAHFTSNGQEAVQAARERAFDVVLMDLHMPVMDGVEATRAIRALPERSRSTVPIVALTADAFDEARERCQMAGMNDFLTKPVSPQQLATTLRRLFGSGASAALAEPTPRTAPPPMHEGAPALLDETVMATAMQVMSGARLAGMIDAFLTQAPETVQHLRAAVRDAQPLELRVNAHAAKGAALNLGLSGLAATAAALHEGAAHLPAHEIARLVQRFESQLPQTRQAVAALNLASRG